MAKVSRIHNRAMLIYLTIRKWRARKYDKEISQEVSDQKQVPDAGRFNKILLPLEMIKAIDNLAAAVYLYHCEMTLPWGVEGARILPAMKFFDYCKGIRPKIEAFEQKVKEFVQVYPDLVDQARINRKNLFRETDYPPVNRIALKFGIRYVVSPLPDVKDFRVDLAEDELEEAKKLIQTQIVVGLEEATREIWTRLHKLVSHAYEKLNDEDSIFRDSLIENLADLCQDLPKLNITNDPELEKMRREVESKICSTDPEDLRKNKELRKEVADSANDILKIMSGYIGE